MNPFPSNLFPIAEFVTHLSALNMPTDRINFITMVMLNRRSTMVRGLHLDSLTNTFGAADAEVVRTFLEQELGRRKRIRDLLPVTMKSMDGESTDTKQARLESVLTAVDTLGALSVSLR